jgi:hypothetical protein
MGSYYPALTGACALRERILNHLMLTLRDGEIYLKKDWESNPFVKRVYLPNCLLVGYKHYIESLVPKMVLNDHFEYEGKEISDDEFVEMRIKYKYHKSMGGYNETK